MTTLYGIKNCDSVKKARSWLDKEGIDYRFHDVRIDGLTAEQVAAWLEQLTPEKLVNKRSTTWKQLPEAEKTRVDRGEAIALILQHPTLIKRPLLEYGGKSYTGFTAEQYQNIFQ